MLARFFLWWGISAISFAITAWILDGMSVSGGVSAYLWLSVLFGAINVVVGTILRIITIPFILLTFGLFLILINAVLLELTDALSSHLTIDSFFWTAIWAAIILSVVSWILDLVARPIRKRTD
jgi:putative membrane protein